MVMKRFLLFSLVIVVASGAVVMADITEVISSVGSTAHTKIAGNNGASSIGLVDPGANASASFDWGGYVTGYDNLLGTPGYSSIQFHRLGYITFFGGTDDDSTGTYVLTTFDTDATLMNTAVEITGITTNLAANLASGRYLVRDECSSIWYASEVITIPDNVEVDVSTLDWHAVDQSGDINLAIINGTATFPNIDATMQPGNDTLSFSGTVSAVPATIDGGGFYIAGVHAQNITSVTWAGAASSGCAGGDNPPTVYIPAVDPVYIQSYLDDGIVNLNAVATDENEPNTLTVLWEVTSLPDGASYSLTPDNELSISAQFDMVGPYTLTVTVNDGVNPDVTSDPVTVEVITNASPVVSAGPAIAPTVYLVDGGTLLLEDASVTDDGEPNGASLIVGWDSVPATGVSFDDASLVNATATFTEVGTYVLTLEADDTELQDSDSITVTVEEKLLSTVTVDSIEDSFTAQNEPDDNDGARNVVQVRSLSDSWAREAYFKFEPGVISGNIHGAELTLQAYGSSRNTVVSTDTIHAVTYGPGGEWFEGNGNTTVPTPDSTGVGITWNNDDLVWGDVLGSLTSTFPGGSNHTFELSNVVFEADGKITLGMRSDISGTGGSWKSRENLAPQLTIYYDPQQAVEVSPEDETSGVHPGTSLIWQDAAGAIEHEVYLGTTSGDLVYQDTVLAAEKISTDPNFFEWTPAAELDLGVEYFWRIDEVFDVNNVRTGEEWSFTVAAIHPDIPTLVSPADLAIVVDSVELVWNEGFAADSHDVYLSTDYALVAALDDSVKIAGVASPLEVTNLDLETEYFWTVQATAASGGPWPSADVYSFTTNNFAALDGFNDGVFWVETPGTGADVNDFVIGAELVMEFSYDDAGDVVSEASLTFAEAKDLSAATGREALTFRLYGQADNDQEDMYIALSDGVTTVQVPVLLEGEPVDLTLPLYKDYEFLQIDLDDFAPVDLSAVTSIAIGFGDGVSEGKSGTVYIDNVNVRTRRCINLFVDGDIADGDCIAGPNDLALMARDWLDAETVVTATTASTDGLIVHFTFDEIVDPNAALPGDEYFESSVGGATGSIVDTVSVVAGQIGNAANMAGAGHVTIDDSAAVLASLADEITVSMWCYGDVDTSGEVIVADSGFRAYTATSSIAMYTRIPNDTGDVIFGTAKMGGSWMSWNDSIPADWTGAWNHYAFVVDAASNFQAVYCNGLMVSRDNDDVSGYAFDLVGLDRFDIGQTPQYGGMIDDFRIYNRALDASEIVDLAGETSVTQSSLSNADIDGDGMVNLVDFAEVASIWLDEILWP